MKGEFSPECFPSIRIAVTGGRDLADIEMVYQTLDIVHATRTVACLAHGGATGADALAHRWAEDRGIPTTPFPVGKDEWRRLGRRAGPMRNRRMLETFKPDVLVAFPGGAGTKDCRSQAARLGIPRLVAKPHPVRGVRLEGSLP